MLPLPRWLISVACDSTVCTPFEHRFVSRSFGHKNVRVSRTPTAYPIRQSGVFNVFSGVDILLGPLRVRGSVKIKPTNEVITTNSCGVCRTLVDIRARVYLLGAERMFFT